MWISSNSSILGSCIGGPKIKRGRTTGGGGGGGGLGAIDQYLGRDERLRV